MTLELTKQLINLASITPDDNGCQDLIADRLQKLGFEINHLPFHDVKNLWAVRGKSAPLFIFLGHTDVVPTGPLDKWHSPPFTATEKNGFLYGRGAQDMKSNIAAMIIAIENFIKHNPNHMGSIGFLLTSDEEGPSINGVAKVVEYFKTKNIKIDYCLVGEPSSSNKVGDIVKVGRRGTLSAELIVHGKQGHIAYPHLADNPIHNIIPALNDLINLKFDETTSLQISNINSGTGATNVIPGELKLLCNFRYSANFTAEQLQEKFESILKKYTLNYKIIWNHSGKPFLTSKDKLIDAVIKSLGFTPELSTSGGTSDGRFIAPLGTEIVELGVCNDTIHQINEKVKISELDELAQVYESILENLLLF
ncbi:MAG TPA: succinyl-diaminopimelate desuccinylase [Gammaproteobacteria bacterium]|nr:succinyl-diaminopimelate desuccinylase [Gammaproteobacteria bacterium]